MPIDRILVAEDDDADAAMIGSALSSLGEPLNIERVDCGAEALERVMGRQGWQRRPGPLPRLLMLDLKMPGIGGLEVLALLRNNRRCRHLPVVVFTSSALAQDIQRSYEAGANAYVVKPLEPAAFREAVEILARFWCGFNRPA